MAEGIDTLPQSLSGSLDEMERSDLVAEALGEHVFEWFIRNKRNEWMEYKTHVTQFELDRYLSRLLSRRMEPCSSTPTPCRPSWRRRSTWPATRGRR